VRQKQILISRWLEGGKLKEVIEWALQGYGRGGKGSLDEEQILIRDGELFGQHPKMGGYPELYNHLLVERKRCDEEGSRTALAGQ
jgi:hypothetical protein